MKFSIAKAALQAELAALVGVTEKKGTIPILAMILVKVTDEPRLEMTASDLDNTMRVATSEVTVEEAGSGCLSARKLFDIVRLLPEGETVTISTDKENWAHVKAGAYKAKAAGVSAKEFPEVPNVPAKTFKVPASILRSLVNATSFAITQEESRYTLAGAKAERNKEGFTLITTDGHRLAYANRKDLAATNGSALDTIIPKKALLEVAKLAASHDGDIEIGCSDQNIRFGVGQRELISRLLYGQFPNYQAVIPKTNKRIVVVETAPLIQTLKRVNIMAEERSHNARFTLTTGQLTITTQNPEDGEATEIFPVDYKAETADEDGKFEIAFNNQYVLEALSATGTEKVQFEFGTADQQAVIRPVGVDPNLNSLSVIMPMRL